MPELKEGQPHISVTGTPKAIPTAQIWQKTKIEDANHRTELARGDMPRVPAKATTGVDANTELVDQMASNFKVLENQDWDKRKA